MRWPPALLALVVLAGCAGPAPADAPEPAAAMATEYLALPAPHADPLADGPLAFATTDYDLGALDVGGPDAAHDGYEYEARIRGTFTIPDGPGPFPFAVFLHGQHAIGTEADPYRNDQGYLYLMEHLATHGIATASILGFEVNQNNGAGDIGMWARAELTLATIDAFANSTYAPRLDLARIALMGHSRGGEGVVTAVEANVGRDPSWPLAGVIALAPTDFAFRSVVDVPFLTLAPYCDGDVYNLHGLRQFDQSRYGAGDSAKVQLLVMGANHNNYNTMWGMAVGGVPLFGAQGDDAGYGRHQNTHCDLPREQGGGRLSLPDTYAEAKLHLGGFLRWTLLGDATLAPYLLGAPQHPDACPGQQDCPGAVHVSSMSPGHRDLVHVEDAGLVPAAGVTATATPGVQGDAAPCNMAGCAENVYSSAWMLDLGLTPEPLPQSTITLAFDAPADLRATPLLRARVAVTTDRSLNAFGAPTMAVTFTDAAGASVTVPVDDPNLFLPPGLVADPGVGAIGLAYVGGAKVSANAVTVAVPAGLDAGNVTSIVFTFQGAGPGQPLPDRILFADAWLDRATASLVPPAA